MPFTDPIVAGDELVRDSMRSSDYVPGVSGWIIRRDGSAEFNAGTFRGSLLLGSADGPGIVLDGNAGTITEYDESGSEYVTINDGGLTVFDGGGSTGFVRIERNPDAGKTVRIALMPTGIGATPGSEAQILATALNKGGVGSPPDLTGLLFLDSPSPGGRQRAALRLQSADVTGGVTNLLSLADGVYFRRAASDVGTGVRLDLKADGTGGIYAVTSGVTEDWKPLTLTAPYTPRAGYQVPQFRKLASPADDIELTGQFGFNGAGNGSILGVLPPDYRPVNKTASCWLGAPAIAGSYAVVEIDTGGNIRLWGHSGGSFGVLNAIFSRTAK